MRKQIFCLLAIFCAWPVYAAPAETRQLTVPANAIVPGAINGAGVELHMHPLGLSLPVLSPDVAARLNLSHSIFKVQARIGTSKLPGRTGVVRLSVNGAEQKRRVLWFARAQRAGADAVLGPGAVPQNVVAFRFGTPDANTRIFQFPLVRQNNRMGTLVRVGQAAIFVQWDFGRARSLATAAAAAAIASAHSGVLVGKPHEETIEFGVERPVQLVRLDAGLTIGPLKISEVDARIRDYGTTAGIQTDDADPSEIIVTAKGRRDRSIYHLIVGARDMKACSRLEFDKAAAIIRLYCS